MSISTAIGPERLARVSGYKIKKGVFNQNTSNLPIVIAVLGEANSANQAGLLTVKREITSAQEAGEIYGYGSPIHQQMRILRPINSDGVGGIPTVVYPQESDVAATATTNIWEITGNATASATHYVIIAGRRSIDFQNYAFTVVKDDTPTMIAAKIADAVNGVVSSPVTASAALGVVTFTTKWEGATSAALDTSFDTGGVGAGVTYAQTGGVQGAGTVDLNIALGQFQEDWNVIVLNPYGADATVLTALETFNGVPDDENPTGQFQGRIFRPFVALFGSTLSDKDDLAAITDLPARVGQVTNALCPAPNSAGFPSEASANMCALFARLAQDTPELDVDGANYPDMPVPGNNIIGDMSDYNNRDFLVKKGCSTVILQNGKYRVEDFVTTYHPEGESPLQFQYPRNLIIDWNIRDGYSVLEKLNVEGHVLVRDGQVTDAAKSVKPKQWKGILFDYLDDLAIAALINDPDFSKESTQVEIDPNNPNRFNTFFRYKRTGTAKIQSTDVEAGF